MNVLFLSSWYPTKQNPNFGVFVREHAHAIHAVGHNVVVVAVITVKSDKMFEVSTSDFFDDAGVRTIIVEIRSRFKDALNYLLPLHYFFLKKRVTYLQRSGYEPQLVHSNVLFPAGIMGSWISRNLSIPHVITEHWSRLQGFFKKPVLSAWGRKAYLKADKIMPVSLFLQNRIQTFIPELDDAKFRVVGNVIDSKIFTYQPKSEEACLIRFCAIATWANKKIPDKSPELFIEALSLFQKQTGKKAVLTMIGGGDKVPQLRGLCAEMNVEAVFTGYISKPEIARVLQASDYFLHASTIETFGVVIVEALLSGIPVLCSNVGALPELIDDTNGVLCENDVQSWLEGLRKMVDTPFDNEAISKRVNNEFSFRNIGSQFTAIYDEVLTSR